MSLEKITKNLMLKGGTLIDPYNEKTFELTCSHSRARLGQREAFLEMPKSDPKLMQISTPKNDRVAAGRHTRPPERFRTILGVMDTWESQYTRIQCRIC